MDVLSCPKSFTVEHIRVGKALCQDCPIGERTMHVFHNYQLSNTVESSLLMFDDI